MRNEEERNTKSRNTMPWEKKKKKPLEKEKLTLLIFSEDPNSSGRFEWGMLCARVQDVEQGRGGLFIAFS